MSELKQKCLSVIRLDNQNKPKCSKSHEMALGGADFYDIERPCVGYRVINGRVEYLTGRRGMDGAVSFGYMPDDNWILFTDEERDICMSKDDLSKIMISRHGKAVGVL